MKKIETFFYQCTLTTEKATLRARTTIKSKYFHDIELVDYNLLFGFPGTVDLLPLLNELIDGVAAFLQGLLRGDVSEALPVDIGYKDLVARAVVPVPLDVVDPARLQGTSMPTPGLGLRALQDLLDVFLLEDEAHVSRLAGRIPIPPGSEV